MEPHLKLPRSVPLIVLLSFAGGLAAPRSAAAAPFFFSTGNVNGQMASAARPDSGTPFEIETGDDFVLNGATSITNASFTGLLVGPSLSVADFIIEIYRVFPLDSDVGRTSGAPDFSTPEVPTRVNSPSDVAFDSRDSSQLSFTTTVLNSTFTAANSVQPGGIHPKPNQTTGGNGPITGQEVTFNVTFNTPFSLPADHYFFVPQVRLTNGEFYWLSSVRPIVSPGTPFAPDLQAWARDGFLDPDWLRIGTDIVGGTTPPTFNMAYSLTGTVPEPGTLSLLGIGLAATARRMLGRRSRTRV